MRKSSDNPRHITFNPRLKKKAKKKFKKILKREDRAAVKGFKLRHAIGLRGTNNYGKASDCRLLTDEEKIVVEMKLKTKGLL